MRLLFLGDVVGRPGRQAVTSRLPELRQRYKLDFVAVNAENAAGGFGITEAICNELIDAGADVVTLGNHAFDQKEGLVFMPELYDPFRAVDKEVTACALKQGVDAILVDFHAEATSEKQAMGCFLDGRVSLVVGTHTHTPTADERVLPEGTAYMSDAGMCGDYNSVLGMDRGEPLNRFLTKIPRGRMEPATGPGTLAGVAVEIDDKTGLATHVAALRLGGVLAPTEPRFWVE